MSPARVDRDIDKIIGALTSPVRREILALIWDKELAAGDIAAAFQVTKPTISQHLGVLREAGLVIMTVAGTSRRYRARPEMLNGLRGAFAGDRKWIPADDIPEQARADAFTTPVVVATVAVDTDQETTFSAFTDPATFSRWLGAPVRIRDGRFAATMEWGTEIRGRYELVYPPHLIVMRWDFEDDTVPVPGGEFTGYLRVRGAPGGGATVEVHQLVDTPEQAVFMQTAWTLVFGRLQAGVAAATDPETVMPPRARRSKRRH